VGALLLLEAPGAYQRVTSPVGGEWASRVSNAARLPDIGAGVLLVIGALVVLARWRRERSIGYLALAAAYGAVAWKFRLQLAHVHPAVDAAYALMLATPVVPLVARGATDLLHMVKPSYLALGFGALGLVHIAVSAGPITTFPTDALEQLLVARWRRAIPQGNAVLYVSRAGNHMSVFPTRDANDVAMVGVSAEESASADATSVTHYLHGSPCTTTAGRDACSLLEARLMLEPVVREVLPARPSQFDLAFDRSEVPIVLYRVIGRR
jgi:hypothetical protein